MKVHCYNILLFSFTLIILLLSPSQVNNQMNHYNRAHMKNIEPTKSYRSLCECELYMPNYDNDPEMKAVMQQFVDRTTQRFHEYDERMKTTRQKCKDKCHKEIEKIILKDKMEKQMAQQLTTLETKIGTDDIPTCICEKSIADKVEKNCMKCAQNLGGIVAPSTGVLAGIAEGALYAWKPTAIAAAMELAKQAGATAGLKAGNTHGMNIVIHYLKGLKVDTLKSGIYKTFVNNSHYTEVTKLASAINTEMNEVCSATYIGKHPICALRGKLGVEAVPGKAKVEQIDVIRRVLNEALEKAKFSADTQAAKVSSKITADLTAEKTGVIESGFNSSITSINASIFAIVVIVLIMVIIYLILRYRRKKKMKKKLQYIKLLEE